MLTKEEFIQQERANGERIHLHDSVWWREEPRQFCRPVLLYERVRTGVQKPRWDRSILGYSHLAAEGCHATGVRGVHVYEVLPGGHYGLEELSKNRRHNIRRGSSRNRIGRIESLEPHIEELQALCMSTAERSGAGLPADFYVKQFSAWRTMMLTLFALPGREWWGAFNEGRLVAYFYGYQVEEALILVAAKAHSDYLKFYPMDALLYAMLDEVVNRQGCKTIYYGEFAPDDEALTSFKEKHRFTVRQTPVFQRIPIWTRWAAAVRDAYRHSPSVGERRQGASSGAQDRDARAEDEKGG